MRVVFVGEAPSRPVDVAFKGDTPNGAGKRLAALLEMSPEAMHGRRDWTFVNLFSDPVKAWDRDAAGLAAWRVCAEVRRLKKRRERVTFVYLGRRVAQAMNYDKPFFTVTSFNELASPGDHVVVPHPSGRSRLWNDESNVARFRKTMRDLGVL